MVRRKLLFLALVFVTLACTENIYKAEPVRGVYHRVESGETLSGIARSYQVSVQDLAEYNNITQPDMIAEDSVLFIPGATRMKESASAARKKQPPSGREQDAAKTVAPVRPVEKPAVPQASRKKAPTVQVSEKATGGGTGNEERPHPQMTLPRQPLVGEGGVSSPVKEKSVAVSMTRPPPTGDTAQPESPKFRPRETHPDEIRFDRQRFIWPVKGNVKTRFGIQPNGLNANGIEIDAREDTPILAASGGTVIFSDTLKDYGETIIIKHDDDFKTVYIHLKNRRVSRDKQVKRGEQIAIMGRPETKREPFWNFEIRYKNRARNPLFYLP